jgi:hypothetical protein
LTFTDAQPLDKRFGAAPDKKCVRSIGSNSQACATVKI